MRKYNTGLLLLDGSCNISGSERNLNRLSSVDDCYQLSVHLAQWVQRRKLF